MDRRRTRAATYEAGANLTYEMVGRFKIFGSGAPEFWFPPPELGLLASLADVGKNLARNVAAHELVAQLIAECDRRKLGDCPTAMMLLACLELHNIPVKHVPFEKLGIKGQMLKMPRGGWA